MNCCRCIVKQKVKSEANGKSFYVCALSKGGCGEEIVDSTMITITVNVKLSNPVDFVISDISLTPPPVSQNFTNALLQHERNILKRLGMSKHGPCDYGGCGKDGICSHQNTQYNDERSNYNTLCEEHQVEVDEHWAEMWADYYSGCL